MVSGTGGGGRLLGGGRGRAAEADDGQEHRDEEALFHTHQYGRAGKRLTATDETQIRQRWYASKVTERRRHMSMLRSYTWADLLTIANASCGTIAIFLCLDYLATNRPRFLWAAFILLPAALVFDVLDGYVARLDKKRQSVLGADLDSLADVISFGVAPAVLGFTLGMRGGWDMLILTYFVVCGVSRLARFNVTSSALADETPGR